MCFSKRKIFLMDMWQLLEHLGGKLAIRKSASEQCQEINSTQKRKNVKAERPARELLTAFGRVRSCWLGEWGPDYPGEVQKCSGLRNTQDKEWGVYRRRHRQRTTWLSREQHLHSHNNIHLDSDKDRDAGWGTSGRGKKAMVKDEAKLASGTIGSWEC